MQLCSGRYHGNHALSLSAGVTVLWFYVHVKRCHDCEKPSAFSPRQWRICAAIALLSCWESGFQCLLRGSDELLKIRKERSQTEGGEDVTAAACCVYTMSVIFTARNQTVMCDRAHSWRKLLPANNTIIVLWHNYSACVMLPHRCHSNTS